MLSQYTSFLASRLCGGSSRKLIAGWWYSILAMTALLAVVSFAAMGRRPKAEAFASIWSALLLLALSIGGTMIMRKFHNSLAVGFFMGGIVATSQLFFLLFLLFIGYGRDQRLQEMSSKEEAFMAICALVQSILLGSFAIILAAHRSEILDKPSAMNMMDDELHDDGIDHRRKGLHDDGGGLDSVTESMSYEAPSVQA